MFVAVFVLQCLVFRMDGLPTTDDAVSN